jgi:polysaccharide biosynthesis transport protein
MEIKAYLSLIGRWAWLIILAALLGGGLAYVVSTQIPPTYEAATTVTVARRSAADSEFMPLSGRPTATYVELLRKRSVLDSVITRLQLDVSAEDLEQQLRVTPLRDTALIRVVVTADDPWLAASIANELVSYVARHGYELLGNDVTIRRYSLHVIDPALPAERPVSPNIPLNTVVLAMVSALLALGGVLIREQLDDRVRTAGAVDTLTGLTTLATIPQPRWGQMHLPTTTDATSSAAESYRMLRAHIMHRAAGQPLRTLLVTSTHPGEGKSTTAANLAVVLAQAGQHVLLVDANLRQPGLHTYFGQANARGLANVLTNPAGDLQAELAPTGIAHLSLLPSGRLPSNPVELVASPQFKQLLERLKAEYDFVVLDSPALLPVIDAVTLAQHCDATLLVVGAGQIRAGDLVRGHERLGQFGLEPLGVVLNRVAPMRGYRPAYQAQEPQPARGKSVPQAVRSESESDAAGLVQTADRR